VPFLSFSIGMSDKMDTLDAQLEQMKKGERSLGIVYQSYISVVGERNQRFDIT